MTPRIGAERGGMRPYGPRIARIALSEAERETLRAVSQMRGFYYKQLGERLGVSGGAVHAYLQGKRHPTSELLARWFEMLTDTS
jgi:DNA-directed RNA polymerase specialized sigma24 family protein